MPSGELHALLKDLAFIVMLSKSFRKSVQLAEASILISNAEPHLLPVLEASILISNAESHVKDFSHGYYQALLPLSYSITSCLYKEAKGPLTFVYTLSVNSIVKLAYSSCLKPSSLLCFPKLLTKSNYLLPCPAKPLQASNCFQTRPRPYTLLSPLHVSSIPIWRRSGALSVWGCCWKRSSALDQGNNNRIRLASYAVSNAYNLLNCH